MIKLVASDLDGTILLNGAQHVDDSMCETIDMLGRKGIIFAYKDAKDQMEQLKAYLGMK